MARRNSTPGQEMAPNPLQNGNNGPVLNSGGFGQTYAGGPAPPGAVVTLEEIIQRVFQHVTLQFSNQLKIQNDQLGEMFSKTVSLMQEEFEKERLSWKERDEKHEAKLRELERKVLFYEKNAENESSGTDNRRRQFHGRYQRGYYPPIAPLTKADDTPCVNQYIDRSAQLDEALKNDESLAVEGAKVKFVEHQGVSLLDAKQEIKAHAIASDLWTSMGAAQEVTAAVGKPKAEPGKTEIGGIIREKTEKYGTVFHVVTKMRSPHKLHKAPEPFLKGVKTAFAKLAQVIREEEIDEIAMTYMCSGMDRLHRLWVLDTLYEELRDVPVTVHLYNKYVSKRWGNCGNLFNPKEAGEEEEETGGKPDDGEQLNDAPNSQTVAPRERSKRNCGARLDNMTVLPGDTTGDPPPVPFKRKRLCLSLNSDRVRSPKPSPVASNLSAMDALVNIPALTAGGKLSLNKNENLDNKYSSSTSSDFIQSSVSSSSNALTPSRKVKASPIATLNNMGNTCYLNSVLYTLRFTPNFLHNMHHVSKELGQQSVADDDILNRTEKVHAAYLRLHELFTTLKGNEDSKNKMQQPFSPSMFLSSFRDLYPTFESNQQHDAHELFVCLFDIIRDASAKLLEKKPEEKKLPATPSPKPQNKLSAWSKKKKTKVKLEVKEETPAQEVAKPKLDLDFVKQLEGTTVLRTICLECEGSTERKEKFLDICVPMSDLDGQSNDNADAKENPSKLYRSLLLSSENINGQNKYWCEVCKHHNEVRRCTSYELLPNLMVLQIKRFSTDSSSVFSSKKMLDFMPTPLILDCFCESCPSENPNPEHAFQLYAVIMHLGSTMASGHYVAYVRAEVKQNYSQCQPPTMQPPPINAPASGIRKFLRKPDKSSSSPSGACPAADCCGAKFTLPDEIAAEAKWLECDDDHVHVLTESEFDELLQPPKSKTLSPYILFYARKNLGFN